jgi:hypothetical protein
MVQPGEDEVEAELELRVKAEPECAALERKTRTRGPAFWGKRVMFYAVVALCLTIASGWTQQVLEEFEERRYVAASVVALCGSSRGISHS